MSEITGKAHGKINLNLDVTGKREDGYHLVRMVMQTVDICDTVTITETEGNEIELTTDSGKIPSGPENLVWRAADVMRREYGLTGGLRIHLDKRIPIAAGMAGGWMLRTRSCRSWRFRLARIFLTASRVERSFPKASERC